MPKAESFLQMAGTLAAKGKIKVEKKIAETRSQGIDKKLKMLSKLQEIFAPREEGGALDFSAKKLVFWINFLNKKLRDELPPEMVSLVTRLPEIDEGEAVEVERVIGEQAKEAGVSAKELLNDWVRDDDPENRERAGALLKLLEAKEELEELKPQLRDFALKSVQELQVASNVEKGMSREELAELQEKFRTAEAPPQDYESYAKWLKGDFVENVSVQSDRNHIERLRSKINEDKSRSLDYLSRVQREEVAEILVTDKKRLDDLEKKLNVRRFLRADLFDFARNEIEKVFPKDEPKKRLLLERVAGRTVPGFVLEGNLGNTKLDGNVFDEFGAAGKPILQKLLQFDLLDNLGAKSEENIGMVSDYFSKLADVDNSLAKRSPGMPDIYMTKGWSEEDWWKWKKERVADQAKSSTELFNQIEAVLRMIGFGKGVSPIAQTRQRPLLRLGRHAGDQQLSLLQNDDVYFESAADEEKRRKQVAEFEGRFSGFMRESSKMPAQEAYTRADAFRLAREAMERARTQVIVEKGTRKEVAIVDDGEKQRLAENLASERDKSKKLETELNFLKTKVYNEDQEKQLAEVKVANLEKRVDELSASNRRLIETDEANKKKLAGIRAAVKDVGFGGRGEAVDKVKALVG